MSFLPKCGKVINFFMLPKSDDTAKMREQNKVINTKYSNRKIGQRKDISFHIDNKALALKSLEIVLGKS